MDIQLSPVAYVRSPRTDLSDDNWGQVVSEIHLVEHLPESCFDSIAEFSHLEIVFYFHRVQSASIVMGSEHPRENPDWPKVGIFAQRKKSRPNCLGLTSVELLGHRGRILHVKGLDAIDGTPILDIKPQMKEFLPRQELVQPDWATELMSGYWS